MKGIKTGKQKENRSEKIKVEYQSERYSIYLKGAPETEGSEDSRGK